MQRHTRPSLCRTKQRGTSQTGVTRHVEPSSPGNNAVKRRIKTQRYLDSWHACRILTGCVTRCAADCAMQLVVICAVILYAVSLSMQVPHDALVDVKLQPAAARRRHGLGRDAASGARGARGMDGGQPDGGLLRRRTPAGGAGGARACTTAGAAAHRGAGGWRRR